MNALSILAAFFIGAFCGAYACSRLPPPGDWVKVQWETYPPRGLARVQCEYRADLNFARCK